MGQGLGGVVGVIMAGPVGPLAGDGDQRVGEMVGPGGPGWM